MHISSIIFDLTVHQRWARFSFRNATNYYIILWIHMHIIYIIHTQCTYGNHTHGSHASFLCMRREEKKRTGWLAGWKMVKDFAMKSGDNKRIINLDLMRLNCEWWRIEWCRSYSTLRSINVELLQTVYELWLYMMCDAKIHTLHDDPFRRSTQFFILQSRQVLIIIITWFLSKSVTISHQISPNILKTGKINGRKWGHCCFFTGSFFYY